MSETQSTQPGQFCWCEVAVKDSQAALAFYGKLFGWKSSGVPMEGGPAYFLLKLENQDFGGLYELSKEQLARGVPPHWLPYVEVESADKTAETAGKLGAKVVMGPFDVMTLGRMAVLVDPQGATFAIWQAKQRRGAVIGMRDGAPGWYELATRDLGKAKEFYSKLFGWQLDTKSHHGMEYTEIMASGQAIGGMMALTKEHGPTPPHWLTYFTVGNCDERVALAQRAGGSVIVPPMDIPTVGRFAVLADPSGASFAIIHLAFSGEHLEKLQSTGAKPESH